MEGFTNENLPSKTHFRLEKINDVFELANLPSHHALQTSIMDYDPNCRH